jgi:hypothetical protein
VSDAARARAKREEKLKLPDGVDRALYCGNGHLRSTHQRTVIDRTRPSGLKTECGACKSERDASRSAKASWWMPRIESRIVGRARTLSEPEASDSHDFENKVEPT